jgi:uncharacterized protein
MHAGIDFGSKRSGKTAVCMYSDDTWIIRQSKKDSDADTFLEAFIQEFAVEKIFIDAPLSLPRVYLTNDGDDYFYRKADKEVSAMSPMFLGGLTARAMSNKHRWEAQGRQVWEAYPAALVRELNLITYYRKYPEEFQMTLQKQMPVKLPPLENWHQTDALLAWITGYRMMQNEHRMIGDPDEGLIYI